MDSVVVFRFDRAPEVCRSVIRLLRALNPGVAVHGLGERIGIADALDTLHVIEGCDPEWHWKHGDLALCEWFEAVGRELSFDRLHLIEWDLLPCAPLRTLYADVPRDAVAVTARTPMTRARADGWSWVTDEGAYQHADDYREVGRHLATALDHDRPGPACLFPGVSVPRSFLAAYAALDGVPAVTNDEVRLPWYAEALGYETVDTGFRSWDGDGRGFNTRGDEIPFELVERELRDPNGRRVFHPVRSAFDPDRVLDLVVGRE